jgi:uncharacterized protein with GYD domain
MARYVVLGNWTDQGVRDFAATVDRADRARELTKTMGGGGLDIYWTLGPHDFVAVADLPDDETAEAFLLRLGAQGNVKTTTMRAFAPDEMRKIISTATG